MEPGLMFAIATGGILLLVGGMGASIAAGLYGLDRLVRDTKEEVATREPASAVAASAVSMPAQPSTLTQYMLDKGQADAPTALGLRNNKMGMWVFLASEVIFFTALIGSYVWFRVTGEITRVDTSVLNVPLTAVNTFLLLSSSFTVVLSLEGVADGNRTKFLRMLFATLILGSIFVGVQAFEWNALLTEYRHSLELGVAIEGLAPTGSLFGTIFFVLTGFHGAHVILGLMWLLVVIGRAFRGDFSPQNNLGVETFGLYWHFVDIVWIVLFTIIYLL